MPAVDCRALVDALAREPGTELIETHISWVLLRGDLAYKLKKPLRLPFVDYSTLERRRDCCYEEVRLNRRLAPSLYLGVSQVTGSAQAPVFDGAGPVLEYAVRMRRFPADALFSVRAEAGTLDAPAVDRLAQRLSAFHRAAPAHAGSGAQLHERAVAALAGSSGLLSVEERQALRDWMGREAVAVAPGWQVRRTTGHVREGHGDLHLANLLELDGEVLAFDCIEFDEGLRCIDVMEDVAFALMDFAARGQPGLGWRFFNRWLEGTGDYEGVAGLRLCLVYRALVRALAEHLRQPHGAPAHRYARQALQWATPAAPRLFITHGLPGSGKTFVSQRLLEREGAIRIRSDVERKRLYGLKPLARSRTSGLEIYTPQATALTYARLFELARVALRGGWPVVLDAAFLKQEERRQARALAAELHVSCAILACEAPLPLLHERLRTRVGDASEADAAVLTQLQGAAEPLLEEELALVYPAG